MALREDVFELLRTDPAFREELRRQLLTEDLLGLPAVVRELAEAQRGTDERLQQLTERVDRLTERVDRLTERVDRLTERVDRLTEHVDGLTQGIDRLTEEVRTLVRWQRGEAGRRDGERFERELVRRAPVLFNGGRGGATDDHWVRERLTEQLRARLSEGLLPPEEDPFLADLVWWKGDDIAVVEASVQVNGNDLARAAARASTLARSGARAMAVVVGDEWATADAARDAQAVGVEWKVGSDLSPGFLALRQRST